MTIARKLLAPSALGVLLVVGIAESAPAQAGRRRAAPAVTSDGMRIVPGADPVHRQAYQTDYKVDPVEDLVIVMMTQNLPGIPLLSGKFSALVYQALVPAHSPHTVSNTRR